MNWNAYWRLARFNKPVGILLLWYPTVWALWVANHGVPELYLMLLFLLGTAFMRAAGCVINDIADRKVDKHVARTRLRPLTAGELNVAEALGLLILLLCAALLILIQLPTDCFYLAVISVVITFLYPFCKRFLNAPQFVLGLAFSMGIPMAYRASGAVMDSNMLILFLINFAWIVAYDTMYAMTDREDDLKIGIKSTAIYFASYDRVIIGLLQGCMHLIWLFWALNQNMNAAFYPVWFFAGFVLVYQQQLIKQRTPPDCFKAFLTSVYYGGIMWFALAVGMI